MDKFSIAIQKHLTIRDMYFNFFHITSMKRQYKILSGIFAIMSCVSIVWAQNLGDLMDNLGTNVSFWYTNDTKVSVKNITTTNVVTLGSPIIKDGSGAAILSYTVMYSQYPLTDILEKTDLLNQTKEVAISLTGSTSPFTMDINIENPDKSKKYYFFVIPNDSKQNLWQISNEVWVDLLTQTYGDAGDTVGTTSTTPTHSAADVDMSLAHISHTLNGNIINMTWSAIAGSKTVQIDVMKPGESLYTKLATVSMNAEKYAYTADKNGEYVFRFIAVDCNTQVTYTVTMQWAQTAATPSTPAVITKVPKTGPAENMLVILLISGLLYFGYSKFYRKTK